MPALTLWFRSAASPVGPQGPASGATAHPARETTAPLTHVLVSMLTKLHQGAEGPTWTTAPQPRGSFVRPAGTGPARSPAGPPPGSGRMPATGSGSPGTRPALSRTRRPPWPGRPGPVQGSWGQARRHGCRLALAAAPTRHAHGDGPGSLPAAWTWPSRGLRTARVGLQAAAIPEQGHSDLPALEVSSTQSHAKCNRVF